MFMKLKNVGVIGAGAMGSGIAQVSAVAGYDVVLQDVYGDALEKANASIVKSLSKMVSKEKMTKKDMDAAINRITYTSELENACKNTDLVIEAIFENLEIKHDMFRNLASLCKKEAILGTNTSALSITEIASVTDRGDKIIGIHFMNPVPLMKGVEVIRGELTSDETLNATLEFIKGLGKESILAVDYAGFIASRIVDVLFNEVMKLIQEGNSPEEIDKVCTLCLGHPMGPCRLLDLAGADIAMHGMETMARDFGDAYKPHPLLKKRVLAGKLGQKTGRGFYEY
jgi:3-hydroxybutyryl-CoA dehydrogenase